MLQNIFRPQHDFRAVERNSKFLLHNFQVYKIVTFRDFLDPQAPQLICNAPTKRPQKLPMFTENFVWRSLDWLLRLAV